MFGILIWMILAFTLMLCEFIVGYFFNYCWYEMS